MRTVLATLFALALLAAPASAQQNPIFQSPGIPPPGANDPACKPAANHPYPVILVHGTFGDMTVSWNTLAPALESKGFCVWALDYGRRGTGPIDTSADQLVAFIDMVRAKTGAAKVSLIGHSQGGMLARYVAVRRGRLGVVDDIIGLAPSSHGTTQPLAGPAGVFGCTACVEQQAGSPFMRKVNEPPPEAPGPAWYTVVTTTHDEVVTPYQSQALAGDHATNVILQDRCPADVFEHVTIVGDPVAQQWAINALERPGAADPNFQPDCTGLRAPAPAAPLRVTLGRRAAKVKRGRAGIRVRCAGPAGALCIGRLQARGKTKAFRVPAGQSRVVRMRVGNARRVKVRALLPQPGGGVATTSRRYRLR
jgi:pimeloyl-ACP methyl ester carboxylesterase